MTVSMTWVGTSPGLWCLQYTSPSSVNWVLRVSLVPQTLPVRKGE